MFTKILLVICVLLAGALIPGHARAQDLVSAIVLSIEGQVEIRRPPGDQARVQKIAFKVEDELKAGDTIITGKNGRLSLGLSDGSQAVFAGQMTSVLPQRTPNAPSPFKAGRNDSIFEIRLKDGKHRIAVGVSRHDFGHGGSLPSDGGKPDIGRGVPRPNGGGAKKP